MERRIIGVVLAVVLAAVGTGVLVAYVKGAERRALAGERTVGVLVVQAPVAQGTPAADLEGLVEEERIPAKVQAVDSVDSLDELDGMVAAIDLVPGEQLVATRFAKPDEVARQGDVKVPDGLQQVTVPLEPHRAVGGRIVPGDTVGVFLSFEPFELEGTVADGGEGEGLKGKTSNTTHLTFHKVLVTNVQGQAAPPAGQEGDDAENESTAPNPAPGGNFLVTLALDSAQAERVVFAAEFGTLWLSNEPDTAVEDGASIKTRGNVYP